MTFDSPRVRGHLSLPVTPGFSWLRAGISLVSLASLVACGGGDGVSSAGTPAAGMTQLSGAVVKGPVSGAQVCAFGVVGSSRGAALGGCSSTDVAGNYTLNVPVSSGAVWLEATGGSYTDEATAALTTLPAGLPLTSLVTANGGTLAAMLTPLTTLAFNTARSTAGANGTLDTAAFNAGALQVLNTFNLPAALNLNTTLPGFGAALNAYGAALTNISRMVAAGQPLTQILNAAQVASLQASYASASANPTSPPAPTTTPPTAPTPGTAIASGSVAVAGGRGDFIPQSDGFEVGVESSITTYRFFRKTPTAVGSNTVLLTSEINVTVPFSGEPSVTYLDAAAGFTTHFCFTACGVSVTAPTGATHPVSLSFVGTVLSGSRTLSGSLTGDATGALWSAAELPRTTDGMVSVNGSNVGIQNASDLLIAAGANSTQRAISLSMVDGSVILIGQLDGAAPTVTRVKAPATSQACTSNCGVTLTDSVDGVVVRFAGTTLSGSVTLANTIFIGKIKGTLTSNQLGSFTPTSDNVTSLNDVRTITFNNLGTSASAGISLVTVQHRAGRVISASVTTGIASTVHGCFEVAGAGRPACAGITVGSDGKTLTFTNTALAGGAVNAAVATITLNGTLQGKGQ